MCVGENPNRGALYKKQKVIEMVDTKKYLAHMFMEFERLGYSEEQIVAALYDYYQQEMVT